ncbi:ATP synthase subunit C lysine N-methyltransferase isoform X9 [Mustela nigripes]|uniref:ATP synthase subunit C lysine N-methyltransferase isoform X9 n=1 Tax=Mustela nigripes TaxID=77151 RepID=UPI002814BF60|nr:ATP synthase subunit C lysine N-methyltransferase isoform X9 [Mustela nigripes]
MEGGGGAPPAVLEENESRCVPAASRGADGSKRSSWGFLFTGIVGGTLVAVYAVATPFLTPALRKICLPFVPATTKQIENVVKMLHCRTGSLVDIGSGDGRIVIAAAKAGFRAVGYELNPWLVWYSRYRAWREGVQDSAQFYISDLWKVTFSQYSNIIVFGVPQMVLTGCTQPEARLLWGSVLEFHQSSVLGQRSRCTRGETDPEEQMEGSGPSIHSVLPSPAEATCEVPPAVLMQGEGSHAVGLLSGGAVSVLTPCPALPVQL